MFVMISISNAPLLKSHESPGSRNGGGDCIIQRCSKYLSILLFLIYVCIQFSFKTLVTILRIIFDVSIKYNHFTSIGPRLKSYTSATMQSFIMTKVFCLT